MALMLIHPDYQKGSSFCPVCNTKIGIIRRNSHKLCQDCNKAVIEQNPENEPKQAAKINSLVEYVMMLIYGIVIILFDIGYGATSFLRVTRDAAYGQRQYPPHTHVKYNYEQTSNGASLHVC